MRFVKEGDVLMFSLITLNKKSHNVLPGKQHDKVENVLLITFVVYLL